MFWKNFLLIVIVFALASPNVSQAAAAEDAGIQILEGKIFRLDKNAVRAERLAGPADVMVVFGRSDSGKWLLTGVGVITIGQANRVMGGYSLHITDLTTGAERVLAPKMEVLTAAWRPGRDEVAFTTMEPGLYMMDDLESEPRLLQWEVSGFAWRPDGQALAITRHPAGYAETLPTEAQTEAEFFRLTDSNIWVHDFANDSYQQITDAPLDDYNPVWSPAGDALLFTSTRTGYASFFRYDFSSGSQYQLTNLEPSPDIAENIPVALTNKVKWSPASGLLTYETAIIPGSHQIWIFDPGTIEGEMIGLGRDPEWVPDGKAVTYQSADSKLLKYSTENKVTVEINLEGGR